jgi:hypothetical protein
MFRRCVFRAARALFLGGVLALSACSTVGNQFDTTDLRFLVPGETTLQEAVVLLQGEPVNVYRRLDGSAIARWAHTATLATDAVYFNQELWLAFDSSGRFERIVKSNNVPRANLFSDGRRVDAPPLPVSSFAAPPQAVQPEAAPVANPPPPPPGPVGGAAQEGSALPHPAVSYPLSR